MLEVEQTSWMTPHTWELGHVNNSPLFLKFIMSKLIFYITYSIMIIDHALYLQLRGLQ